MFFGFFGNNKDDVHLEEGQPSDEEALELSNLLRNTLNDKITKDKCYRCGKKAGKNNYVCDKCYKKLIESTRKDKRIMGIF